MIWALMAMILMMSDMKSFMIISETTTMDIIMINIMMMSLMAMMLNYMMMNQTTLKEEKKMLAIITTVGIMVMMSFLTDSPMIFMIMMELTVAPLTYMILNSSKEKDKIESVKFMVMLNTAGSVPFMGFIMWMSNFLETNTTPYNLATEVGIMLLMILFLVKTPMFLVHMWLTKVHVSATGNCSMILASIMIKMGTVGIFKFYKNFGKEKMIYLLSALSLTGSLYLTIIMLRYYDSKTLIAMSSVLHMATMIPMMMMKKKMSMISSIMMMTSHGIISYFLFYLITVKYETAQNRSPIMMKSDESIMKMMTLILIIFMFLNLGLPPFMNFLSETMFLFTLKGMNSMTCCLILATVLMLSVMFTMQMNSNTLYGKTNYTQKKNMPVSMLMKSIFFTNWSFLILWSM